MEQPKSLRAKLLSLFEPMPVCPHFTRDHPDAVAQVMSDYLAHQAHGKGAITLHHTPHNIQHTTHTTHQLRCRLRS
jgi:hypothetical protein